MLDLILTSMKISSTTNEIKPAVRKPKNNKIPGKAETSAEAGNLCRSNKISSRYCIWTNC